MRKKHIFTILITGLFAILSLTSFAQEHAAHEKEGHGKVNTKEGIKEFIHHHLRDSHYFTFFSNGETGEHYGAPLPVIIYDKENGLKAFSASLFHHGEELAKIDGQHYKLYHSKIYKTNADGKISLGKNGFPTNERPLDFSLTKNVLTIFIICVLLFLIFAGMAKSYKKDPLPKRGHRFLEPVILYIRDDIAKPNIGTKYKKHMSFLLTIFFFILFMNLLGITPLGVNITGNITVTFALALVTFFIVQFSGNRHYWKHIFWFPGVPWPMKIVLMPIEVLGVFTKPFALMIRLFANMTAGHVVIMSLLGLIVVFQNWFAGPAFFGFSLFISVIEILVAFLQAYVFTLLSALYIGMAVEEHKEHPEDHSEDIPIV